MLGHLLACQGDSGLSAALALSMPVTDMNRRSATQIRQGKVDTPITAVLGTQEGKQGLVLIDGQQLSVAQRPALGGKVEAA